jgi:hypothetical protein
MASYLEIKQLLRNILCLEEAVDETCDLRVPIPRDGEEPFLLLSNDILREAFDKMQSYSKNKLELSTASSREISLQFFSPITRLLNQENPIIDTVNGLSYSIGPATLEYCMFLLDRVADYVRENNRRIHIDLRHRSRNALRHGIIENFQNPLDVLPEILCAQTLKVNSNQPVNLLKLRDYAASFEFLLMYKQNIAVSEYSDVQDMYIIGRSLLPHQRETMDTPPQRIFNVAVLDYYTLAMESKDPFSMYISFYHVIEHYFDAVFKKKLTEEMQNRITHPDFSYKSEEKLYELAKYIKKHLNSDDESGKGNEFESLKYVLAEYVPIDELKRRISALDAAATSYYQTTKVPFATGKETKIPWTDTQGVYTKLATRIYETRNALVHSKSEQAANQYKPYENKNDLLLEISLVRAAAELVLINSSKPL